jgi:protein pelota
MNEFFEVLRIHDDKCCYGINSVKYAMENMEVKTLLISDHLFRAKNNAIRLEYVKLHEKAEKNGIKVVVFGSNNPTG